MLLFVPSPESEPGQAADLVTSSVDSFGALQILKHRLKHRFAVSFVMAGVSD